MSNGSKLRRLDLAGKKAVGCPSFIDKRWGEHKHKLYKMEHAMPNAATFVERILARKGQDVNIAPGDLTLGEAGLLMLEKKVGSVLVVGAGNQPLGILTDRDYFRLIMQIDSESTAFAELMNTSLSKLMTRNVVTGTTTMAMETVMDIFSSHRIRHLPIVDENKKLVGLISSGDVLKQALLDIQKENADIRSIISG